jgi:hypothetical protein
LRNGLTIEEIERRQNLLGDLDRTFANVESDSPLLAGMDRFNEQAYSFITTKRGARRLT